MQNDLIVNDRTSDPSDMASMQEQAILAAQIQDQLSKKSPKATGFCLYCSSPVLAPDAMEEIALTGVVPEGTAKFCDSDCRADYDYEIKIKQNQGLIR